MLAPATTIDAVTLEVALRVLRESELTGLRFTAEARATSYEREKLERLLWFHNVPEGAYDAIHNAPERDVEDRPVRAQVILCILPPETGGNVKTYRFPADVRTHWVRGTGERRLLVPNAPEEAWKAVEEAARERGEAPQIELTLRPRK
jgi:hypothetical protein